MQTKVLTKVVDINTKSGVYAFTIDIPNDVAEVIGIATSTNAEINIGVDNQVSRLNTINDFPIYIKEAQTKYNRDNLLKGKIRYKIGENLADNNAPIYEQIAINKFQLGTLNLTSYERCGQFYSGSINAKIFNLNVYGTDMSNNANASSGRFILKSFEDKGRVYSPVNVDYFTTELHGFFEPTTFGKTIETSTDAEYRAGNNFVKPYQIRVYLLCQLK